jgi:formylglycine-generating enzyme required for sulfatase activity
MGSRLWQLIQAHRFELLPLDEDGLHEAIVSPAERVNVYVESALVERLVTDANGEPGVLPLLQETLVLLWEHLERRYLPLRAYDELTLLPRRKYTGVSEDKRTGLQVAMAYHADQALGRLETAEQNMARNIFLQLVQFVDGRAPVRRQQYLSQLSALGQDVVLLERTLEKLAENRLLTLDAEPGQPGRKVDIAHEALITGWDQLAEWIETGKQGELARRELEKAAADWEANGHNTSYLFRGAQFQRVRRILSSDVGTVSVTGQAFLKACQRLLLLTQIATATAVLLAAALIFLPFYNWQNGNRLRQAASGIQVSFSDSTALLGDDRDSSLRTYPQRQVQVPAFALDKYEVTYRQYRLCVQAGRCDPPEEPLGVENFSNAPENYPVTWVTPLQAAAFCRWVGGRLPSEAEWERAMRGIDGRFWPWGAEIPTPEHVNVYIDNFPDFAPDNVVAVDDPSFAGGATPVEEGGITHLIGNVAEITSTPDTCYDAPYDCPVLWDGVSKVGGVFVRGMGYADQISANDAAYSFLFTALAAPADPLGYIGFRCAYSQP